MAELLKHFPCTHEELRLISEFKFERRRKKEEEKEKMKKRKRKKGQAWW